MKKQKNGFSILGILLIVAVIAFGFVYKDESGQTYAEKLIKGFETKKGQLLEKAENAKGQLENRDKDLGEMIEELE